MMGNNLHDDLMSYEKIYILIDNYDRYKIFKRIFNNFPVEIIFCHSNIYSYWIAHKKDLNQRHILLKRRDSRKKNQDLSIEEFKWKTRFNWSVDPRFYKESNDHGSIWIVWGGFQYAWKCLLSELKVSNVYYFEIANFPGRLQCSSYGVNADGRYDMQVDAIKNKEKAKWISQSSLNNIISCYHPPHADKRILGQLMEQTINNCLFKFYNSLAPKITIKKALKTVFDTVRSRRLMRYFKSVNLPDKYDLFIGQVSEDSQTVFQSRETQVSAIKKAYSISKNCSKPLVIRLHPAEKNYSELRAVVDYANLNGIMISNKGTLGQAVEDADKIYTVNSTGGAHALLYGKEVVCFGESYYHKWHADDVCIYYEHSLIPDNVEIAEGIV